MKYEISKGTLAIVPNEDNNSLVYEDNERYIIDQKPYQIMEESCKYFGSTYKGRKDSAKSMLGAEYKVPIMLISISVSASATWFSARKAGNGSFSIMCPMEMYMRTTRKASEVLG